MQSSDRRWDVEGTHGNVVLVTNIQGDQEAHHFTEYSLARSGQGTPGK